MNILHLPYGSPMIDLCQALQQKGINAVSCHFTGNPYHFKPNICLNLDGLSKVEREQRISEFLDDAIKQFDIFHFHFGETFYPNKRDLVRLKEAGKKMVVHHHGSDVRILSLAKKNNPYIRVKPEWTEGKIRSNLKALSNYIDHAFIQDYELETYIKPYYKAIHVIPHSIDLSSIEPAYPEPNSLPLIVHAPTRRDLKGTEFILMAVDQLRKEGIAFNFQLIEGMTYEQVQNTVSKADIIIDQLRIGAYGYVSTEAMAHGKPVICFIREDIWKKYPFELPIINANPTTIMKVLKELIQNPNKWKELGLKGRKYVEKYHSAYVVADQYINIYKNL